VSLAKRANLPTNRATHVALMKERDELKQRFEGIDPDEVRKLADEKRKLEEAQQLKAGEVEKVVETRLRAVKEDLVKKLASATADTDISTSGSWRLSSGFVTSQTDQEQRRPAVGRFAQRAAVAC